MRLDVVADVLLRRFGAPGGAPVVAVHGFGDVGTAFTPLAAHDLGGLEFVAADLPGCGLATGRTP